MAMRARGSGGKKRPAAKAAPAKRTRAKAAAPRLDSGDDQFRRPPRGKGATAVIEAEEAPAAGVHDIGSIATAPSGQALALRDMADGGEISSPFRQAEPERTGANRRRPKELIRESFAIREHLREIRRTPYGVTPVVVLTITFFIGGLNNRAFGVAGPEIARDLEINVQTLVGILSLVGFFAIFANLFVGWWADRHARVPLQAAGNILNGVFSMLTGRGQSAVSLGTPKILGEVAERAGDVPLFSLITDYYPLEVRGRVFSVLGALGRLGQLVSTVLIGAVVVTAGWRPTLITLGAALVVMGVVILFKLKEPVRGYMERRSLGMSDDLARVEDEPQSFGEGWRTTWGIRTLRRIFLAGCIGSVATAAEIFVGFLLAEHYGLNAFERGLIFLPGIVAGLAGAIVGGSLIDAFMRRNPSRVLIILGVFQVIGTLPLLLYILRPSVWIIIAFNVPLAFGGALIGPATSVVYSQIIPPSIRTQGLQVFGLAALPGILFGGTIFRTIFASGGYSPVFYTAVPFGIVSALVFMSASSFFELDMRSAFAASVANEEWRRAKRSGRGKLLVCRDVDVSYGSVQVLFGVDFDVEEGEIIALLGTNGAGKSTLLRAISGTTEASAGAIVFDGRDITHMPPHEIAARNVIHMPGGRGVFPGMTVRENLLLGNWLNDDNAEIKTRMAEVFRIFPRLKERADTNAGDLSGGEQQQLSLAQAFLCKPKLLMIDELSLGLAPAIVGELLEIVRQIRDTGVTIIVVEQSVNVALTIAEKAIFMEKGEVKFFGNTEDLLSRPDILRAVYVKGTGALTDAPRGGRSQRDQRDLELRNARPVLEVEGLVKRYGGVTALDGMDLSLREGEVLGLIGPNGSGKTTSFDLISGYQIPDEGIVRFEGVDITGMSPEERARKKLIRRFQDAQLFPALTVFETLLVALDQRLESKAAVMGALSLPQSRRAERRLRVRAEQLIELLDLGSYRDKFVKELSTGLRRIVDIACVLASEPRVLLLDEPSSGIAQREAESLAPLLRRIRFETGCSILIIEHDMPLISSVSDELVALDRGVVLLRGKPEVVLNDERVIESYLGTSEAAVQRSGSSK